MRAYAVVDMNNQIMSVHRTEKKCKIWCWMGLLSFQLWKTVKIVPVEINFPIEYELTQGE